MKPGQQWAQTERQVLPSEHREKTVPSFLFCWGQGGGGVLFLNCEGNWILEQAVQRGCGVSILPYAQNLTGYNPRGTCSSRLCFEQVSWSKHSRGAFQPQLLYNSLMQTIRTLTENCSYLFCPYVQSSFSTNYTENILFCIYTQDSTLFMLKGIKCILLKKKNKKTTKTKKTQVCRN